MEAVMGWMRVNKLRLNPDKMEILLVGISLVVGSGYTQRLAGFAFTPRVSVCSLGVLLNLSLLLDIQIAALARTTY